MKTLTVLPYNSHIAVRTGTEISRPLLARKCKLAMACGGQGLCATCHVYVKEGLKSLSPMTAREEQTLGQITNVREDSRLSCQARILEEGVAVEVPAGLYVQRVRDLLNLVGRRSTDNILHPKDGRVLIAKGKIITRSRVMELENEQIDSVADQG